MMSLKRLTRGIKMQTFEIPVSQSGERLIRAILVQYPTLTSSLVYKALRKRDVKINGRRVQADQTLQGGETIEIYLPDTCFSPTSATSAGPAGSAGKTQVSSRPPFQVVFNDARLLILNKAPSLSVHGGGDTNDEEPTLIGMVRERWHDPAIELCHRLDRNTGGLIILARRPEIRKAVAELMEQGRLIKRYRCLVRGVPTEGRPITAADGREFQQIEAWLEKVSQTSEVYIHAEKQPRDVSVITRYQVLRIFEGLGPDGEAVSELLVELATGRTHQIRAHLAFIGHPLLGDGKYGRNQYNRHFRGASGPLRLQQLFACQLIFLPHGKGPLADLAGRTFAIEPEYDLVLPT
jgi:23S rRNA pseudouridine955/2504/2580 synthase